MKGSIEFILLDKNTLEVVDSIEVNNVIMDNVLKAMAGSYSIITDGIYSIVLGSGFNDDELQTNLTALKQLIYTSNNNNTVVSHGATDTFFTVQVELTPNDANGDLIEIGIMRGSLLYNRAIFKRQGKLLDNTLYQYKIVGAFGNNKSIASNILSATTPSSSNKNAIKLTWQPDGTAQTESYSIYRKSPTDASFYFLTSTRKLYHYDDGFTNVLNGSVVPSPQGVITTPSLLTISSGSGPVPYSISKTQDFAAIAKVKIQF